MIYGITVDPEQQELLEYKANKAKVEVDEFISIIVRRECTTIKQEVEQDTNSKILTAYKNASPEVQAEVKSTLEIV